MAGKPSITEKHSYINLSLHVGAFKLEVFLQRLRLEKRGRFDADYLRFLRDAF